MWLPRPGADALTQNLKLYLGLVAIAVAVVLLIVNPPIAQGAGVVAAALAAGAGWFFRTVLDEQRLRQNICSAYAAAIEGHFNELSACLSNDELARFRELAPRIASKQEKPSIGVREADPFGLLPDLRDNIHLISPKTLRLLQLWRSQGFTLFGVYDCIGTYELSVISAERLDNYFIWVAEYRDQYRDVGFQALHSLAEDFPGLHIHTADFVGAGARLAPADDARG
jgi:hypothetical protein